MQISPKGHHRKLRKSFNCVAPGVFKSAQTGVFSAA
jgi:hypothetical protein